MRPYLLLHRFAIVNLIAAAFLGAAAVQGWVAKVAAADSTGLVYAIFGVFVVGLALSLHRAARISQAIERARRGKATSLEDAEGLGSAAPAFASEALKARLTSRVAGVRQFANALVVLGLIGTVLGFILALSGIDPETVNSAQAIKPMIARLIEGMSVALYTTLEGAILGLWLTVNYRMLANGTATLYSELLVRHGRV